MMVKCDIITGAALLLLSPWLLLVKTQRLIAEPVHSNTLKKAQRIFALDILTLYLYFVTRQMNCQNSRLKNPRFKAPSELRTFRHVNTHQKNWCSSDWRKVSITGTLLAVTMLPFTSLGPPLWLEKQQQQQQQPDMEAAAAARTGTRTKVPITPAKTSISSAFPPPTEVCRCADVAIVLPNKAESHCGTSEAWKGQQQRTDVISCRSGGGGGGRGDAHWIKKPLAMLWATVG